MDHLTPEEISLIEKIRASIYGAGLIEYNDYLDLFGYKVRTIQDILLTNSLFGAGWLINSVEMSAEDEDYYVWLTEEKWNLFSMKESAKLEQEALKNQNPNRGIWA